MSDIFTGICLAAIAGIIYFAISMSKGKKKQETKFSYAQSKTALIISIVACLISAYVVGVTAPPVEETSSNNPDNSIVNETKQENTTTNEVTENNESEEVENNTNDETEENTSNTDKTETTNSAIPQTTVTLSSIPKYSGKAYVKINNNVPYFNDSELTTTSYEKYSSLDSLGRCGVAIASVGKDIMPTGERGSIGSVKPTGWHTVKYNGIDGNYLYNRCHLLGFQLTGENANTKNLITGTRYMNVEGMLPFENMVADYVKETNNHVLYRVTPMFEGNNLLCSGVLMEAKSVEDNGAGVQFNVYCYNVQPGIEIDYATGKSSGPEYTGTTSTSSSSSTTTSSSSSNTSSSSESKPSSSNTSSSSSSSSSNTSSSNTSSSTTSTNTYSTTYILNNNTKKFHYSSCGSAAKIKASNKGTYTGTRDELIARGYLPCGNCDP